MEKRNVIIVMSFFLMVVITILVIVTTKKTKKTKKKVDVSYLNGWWDVLKDNKVVGRVDISLVNGNSIGRLNFRIYTEVATFIGDLTVDRPTVVMTAVSIIKSGTLVFKPSGKMFTTSYKNQPYVIQRHT
jgi:hypothetical protein